jgi:prepilin-type N-terminal cleavage/methylation domain-containing protein/prepilin-type processing-associated H-X9-DG protein
LEPSYLARFGELCYNLLKCFNTQHPSGWQAEDSKMFTTFRRRSNGGFTLVELLVVIAIIGILVALLLPAIQAARESARRAQCTSNLKNVALAVHNYHDSHKELPAAAWLRPQTSPTDSILTDNRLFWNWVIRILPYLEEQSLLEQFTINSTTPISKDTGTNNRQARGTEIPVMLCPSDIGRNNPFQGSNGNWARGNYGYNAFQFWPNEYWRLFTTDGKYAPFFKFNLGMGGIEDGVERQTLSLAKVTDGTTKTVMLAELRVGLSEHDRRGVWAMGMCGSNLHCRHAAFVPNLCSPGIDDVYQFQSIIDDVGEAQLNMECMMPCRGGGCNASGQSLVRSLHPGGANCAMADASVRFISDFIDSGTLYTSEDGYIDATPSSQTTSTVLGTWQRLNISRDDYAIEHEY